MGRWAPTHRFRRCPSKPKLLFTYFKQLFAQVTNPPIDPIREELVMSLVSFIGPRPNLLDLKGTSSLKRLEVKQPVLTNEDLEKIRTIGDIADNHFQTLTLDITYNAEKGVDGMKPSLDRLCERAEKAVNDGFNIIVLSDRLIGQDRIPIPSLLATSAVHHHLIRKGLRTSVGLVVETGEVREIHHFCTLAGYGAEAINPYLAFETLASMDTLIDEDADEDANHDKIFKRYIKAVNKGILKVMSKMGISTYQSYCGAQIFDAIGLRTEFIEQYFYGTATPRSKGLVWKKLLAKQCNATRTLSATTRSIATHWTSAANMPTASGAKSTCGRRPPWPICSTRCGVTARKNIATLPAR